MPVEECVVAYDLKITNATIVDGSGSNSFRGDIGIRDGRIQALGRAPGRAEDVIDASQCIAAPGFVDIHTHYDAQILWDPMLSISPWHGVTTVVMGNCGFGIAPTRPHHCDLILRTLERVEAMSLAALRAGVGSDWEFETFPEYLSAVEARGTLINVGVYIGHTPIRLYVMGEDAVQRGARADEIASMSRIVSEGMEAGALGFSSTAFDGHNGYDGLPVPSRLADFAEFDALVAAMSASGRGVMQATVGKGLFLAEFERLAEAHGVTIAWTALLSGMRGPDSHRAYLAQTQELIGERGLNIVPQVTPRPLCMDFDFDAPFPFERQAVFNATMKTDREGRRAIYADPSFRAAFKDDMNSDQPAALAGWPSRTVVSRSSSDLDLEGRTIEDVSQERGLHPVDLVLDISLETDFATRFSFAMLNDDEAAVGEILADENTVIGLSDAGAHASQLCDACYATDFLGRWVREKGLLSLEEGVRRLTARPADVLGLKDRGYLKDGAPADIVIFDAETVGASPLRRTFDLPAGADRLVSDAAGIDTVIVNGTVVRRANEDVLAPDDDLPGQLLRG